MATSDKMVRLQVLDECFRDSSRPYFIKDLIEAVNNTLKEKGMQQVGIRTIRKDIHDMRKGYGIVLREDMHGGKSGREVIYRYENTRYSIFKKKLSGEETKQLKNTIEMLRRFKGLPNYKSLEQVLIWLKVNFHLDGMSEGTVMFAQNPYLKGLDLFGDLLDLVMGKKKVNILYAPFGRPKKVRQIHPYQLRQWNYRWYLVGLEERLKERHEYVVVPLDRIEWIDRIYSEGFIPMKDDDFDFDAYFENVVGVSLCPEGKVKPVVAKVYYPNAWYVNTKPIHSSQEVIEETKPWINDGSEKPKRGYMVFKWEVIPNEELVQALMVYADQVEIVEGDWVQKELRKRAKAILGHNGYE